MESGKGFYEQFSFDEFCDAFIFATRCSKEMAEEKFQDFTKERNQFAHHFEVNAPKEFGYFFSKLMAASQKNFFNKIENEIKNKGGQNGIS